MPGLYSKDKRNMKKLIIIIFFAANIFAADYCDGFIKNITTPTLCKLLSQAEQAAENKNSKKACDFIDKALAMKSAPEFSAKADVNGPLDLKLKMAKVFCNFEKAKNNKYKNSKELEKTILSLLEKYQKAAKGKKWISYTWLLQSLAKYYSATKNYLELEKQIDNLMEYAWGDKSASTFINVAIECNLPLSFAENRINYYIKENEKKDDWITFLKIRYKLKEIKNEQEKEKILVTSLEEYQDSAKGKKWESYNWMLNSLAQYYSATKNYPKLEKQVDKILEYSWDKPTVITFLSVGLDNGIPTSIAEKRISEYIKSGKRYNAWINYLRICYKRRDGDDVFQDSLDFLRVYPKSDPNNIIKTLGFLKESLNTDDKEKVKLYLDALNKLAFAQPNSEDRLELVSKILDEKRSGF